MPRLFGTILPYIGVVIAPCDADGNPAMEPDELESARFECRTLMLAWFGQVVAIGMGDVEPRKIDSNNPKRYAPGDL